ncbi:OCIA domain-containing protein 1-like [Eleutherodactylus coqui]|uniref:OCIA domain-containing protein 1-like n=1 Tax=Eleutherodactylus coqui TaxID=57060 RepID=UPI003462BB1D
MDMSSPQPDLSEQPPPGAQRGYHLTEEELRVLRQCDNESFWFRSLPFSVVSLLATQALIQAGKLAPSPRFGSWPKLAFASFFGYFAGKISYMQVCRKKFMELQNSPIAEKMRQEARTPHRFSQRTDHPSQYSDADVRAPLQTFAPVAAEPPSRVYSSEYESSPAEVPFSASMSESSPTGIEDRILVEPEPIPVEAPKQKPVTYEELRDRNRDFSRKPDVAPPRAPVQERKPGVPVKKNKYGDVWEE